MRSASVNFSEPPATFKSVLIFVRRLSQAARPLSEVGSVHQSERQCCTRENRNTPRMSLPLQTTRPPARRMARVEPLHSQATLDQPPSPSRPGQRLHVAAWKVRPGASDIRFEFDHPLTRSLPGRGNESIRYRGHRCGESQRIGSIGKNDSGGRRTRCAGKCFREGCQEALTSRPEVVPRSYRNKEGEGAWDAIARGWSSRFPATIRTHEITVRGRTRATGNGDDRSHHLTCGRRFRRRDVRIGKFLESWCLIQ